MDDIQKIKLEELEKRVNSLAKKIQTNVYAISDMDQVVNQLIENSSYSDYDEYIYPCKRKARDSVITEPIYLTCKKNFLTRICVRAKVHFKGNGSVNGTFKVVWDQYSAPNAAINFVKEYNSIDGEISEIIETERTFVSTQDNYHFRLRTDTDSTSVSIGYGGIDYFEVRVYGADVEILNRKIDFKIFPTQNFFYLTKNTIDGCYYKKMYTQNFSENLNTGYSKVENVIPGNNSYYIGILEPFNFTYIPNCKSDSSKIQYVIDNDDPGQFSFCTDSNPATLEGKNNPEDGLYLTNPGTLGSIVSVGPPTNKVRTGFKLFTYCAIDNFNCWPVHSDPNDSGAAYLSSRFKYNSNYLDMKCCDCSTVIGKEWQNSVTRFKNNYFFITTNAEIYFFPGVESSKMIYIGKGHQVNAFSQKNRSINVYYTFKRNLYKRTLFYDVATDEYTLENKVYITPATTEYFEGKYNDYFIKKEEWKYNSK